jgi:ABC-type transporter Mla MlaB component
LAGYLVRPFGLQGGRAAAVALDAGPTVLDVPQDPGDVDWSQPSDSGLRIEPLMDLFGLRVSGEIDLAGRAHWERALDQAVGRGFDVHIDLSGLTFTDVTGVALLVSAAERLPGGRRLTVHRPPRGWLLIYELFWPAGMATVEVVY